MAEMAEREESVYDYLSFRPTEEQLSVEDEANRAKIEEYRTAIAEVPDESPKIKISTAISNPKYFPSSIMHYVRFSVEGFEVSECVTRWIKSLWGTPKGFATSARVPVRFSRVFVPFVVTTATKKAIMTYTEATYGVGPFRGMLLHRVESKNIQSTVTHVSCIASDETDRCFYSKFGLSTPQWDSVEKRNLGQYMIPDRFVQEAEVVPYRWAMHAREEYNKKSFWQRAKCFFSTSEHSGPRTTYIFPDSYALKYSAARNKTILSQTSEDCQKKLGDEISSTWSRLQDIPDIHRSNLNVQYLTHEDTSGWTIVFLPFYSGMYEAVNEDGNRERFRIAVYGADGYNVEGLRPEGTFGGVIRDLTMTNK